MLRRHGHPLRFLGALTLALAWALTTVPVAFADCSDDLAAVEARTAKHSPVADPKLLQKQLAKAHEDLDAWDELGCINAVARAKALLATPAAPAQSGPVQPLGQPVGTYGSH